jgi:hypothetical protein
MHMFRWRFDNNLEIQNSCIATSDYGHLFVHTLNDGFWTAPLDEPTRLFSEIPQLPRQARAGPSLVGGPLRCSVIGTNTNLLFEIHLFSFWWSKKKIQVHRQNCLHTLVERSM